MTSPVTRHLPFQVFYLSAALLGGALLGGAAALAQPGQLPPPAHGPRPPHEQEVLTPAQAQNILKQARQVLPQLSVGQAVSCRGPGRAPGVLCAPLLLRGQAVSELMLGPDGTPQVQLTLPGPPRPPVVAPTGTLSAAAIGWATAQLRTFAVSAALRVVGPQVRVTLLRGSFPVAELAFNRAGKLLPLPPRP